MVTSSAIAGGESAPTPSASSAVRSAGFRCAAFIGLSWVVASVPGAVLGTWLGIPVAAGLWYLAVGALGGTVVAAPLGRALGNDAAARKGVVVKLAVLTVVGNAALIAMVISMVVGVTVAGSELNDGVADAVMTGFGVALMYAVIALLFGLVVFGLPGLAIAGVSAFIWSCWMRKRFPLGHLIAPRHSNVLPAVKHVG